LHFPWLPRRRRAEAIRELHRPPAATSSERREAERREQSRRKHRLTRIGQVLMAVGALVGLTHWLAHLGAFGGQPSSLVDLLLGYPTAGLLILVGVVAAGQ